MKGDRLGVKGSKCIWLQHGMVYVLILGHVEKMVHLRAAHKARCVDEAVLCMPLALDAWTGRGEEVVDAVAQCALLRRIWVWALPCCFTASASSCAHKDPPARAPLDLKHLAVIVEALIYPSRDLRLWDKGLLLPSPQQRIGGVRRCGKALAHRDGAGVALVVVRMNAGVCIVRSAIHKCGAARVHSPVVRTVSLCLHSRARGPGHDRRITVSYHSRSIACPQPCCAAILGNKVRC
mmetsp:Transcript_150216/g.418524  ORF Transcript_150216/g.418524 Transcript_150216/m.418524 type:complete len:236 (-) Transcript_150216:313-1020(-)